MKKRVDPLGQLLLRSGVLSQVALDDVLDNQRHTLPLASLCYVLGLADEEALVRGLSKQRGVPGVVVDRCVIRTVTIAALPRDVCLRHGILPLYEDTSRLFVAMQDPADTGILRELAFIRGRAVVAHVGLHVTIARALRLSAAAIERGEAFWYGLRAVGREAAESLGRMAVVSDVDHISGDHHAAPPPVQVDSDYQELTDITRELYDDEPSEGPTGGIEVTSSDAGSTIDTPVADRGDTHASVSDSTGSLHSQVELPTPTRGVIDLDIDLSARPAAPGGPPRVLIVDDDFATRHLLVKALAPLGYATDTAASGMEAVKRLRSAPPDAVVIDIMLPELDGFQICRSIKTSRKYRHIPVMLISAVIDSGRVTEEVLVKYGADAYFEKPINVDKLKRRLRDLIRERAALGTPPASPEDQSFDHALDLYREGRIDDAIAALRAGLDVDPLSTKHHFVLANLLQKQNQVYEAIDEYEATVNLKPDYFPALSRLAYLYYKKGFSAKAIETWRRSLPHCPDPALRQNIEVFMRKLIAEMAAER
jgi:DNA-binding response OmpR family regulator